MPLINLRTNLKSLKYGHDRPDGGSSAQPYIQTDINKASSGIPFDEGLVRGGVIGATKSSITDTLRISKFFTDLPKGPLFIAKQIGLQLSAPRLEVPKNPINIAAGGLDNTLAFGTNGLLSPTRIYNLGINTIAQIPVTAFGLHFNRHGLLPIQDKDSKYEAVVKANNNLSDQANVANTAIQSVFGFNPKFTQLTANRLVLLKSKFKLGDRVPNDPLNGNQLIIDQYIAGPGSVYGVGNTIIHRAEGNNTENGAAISESLDNSRHFAGYTRNDKGDQQNINYTSGLGKGSNAISTFNDQYNYVPTSSNEILRGLNNYAFTDPSTNWKRNSSLNTYQRLIIENESQQFSKNIYKEYKSGSTTLDVNQFGIYKSQRDAYKINNTQGEYDNTPQDYIAYKNPYNEIVKIKTNGGWNTIAREQRVGSGRKDQINLTPLFTEGSYFGSDTTPDGLHNTRDLVKFRIQAVNTHAPSSGTWMIFRALLTNFTDNVDAKWTDINYVGRGNPFYIYNGFSRKIQIGFKVAALSAEEMQPMYSKLNYLMSNLMPDYTDSSGNPSILMKGPLVRMTVGNYLDAQLGKLDSVSYTIPNDSPWEIALDEPEGGTKQLILPHILEVQISFTPIGAETGLSTNGNGSVSNKIEEKSQKTSYLAQNTTGADVGTIQYIK